MVCMDCVFMSFVLFLSCVVFDRSPCTLLNPGQGKPSKCAHVVKGILLHYKTLACESLITLEIATKNKNKNIGHRKEINV